MTINKDQIRDELALFADLGTETPRLAGREESFVVRLIREGERIELTFESGVHGRVIEKSLDTGEQRRRSSYRALLATEKFADLDRWAASQRVSLEHVPIPRQSRQRPKPPPIPMKGVLSDHKIDVNPERIDNFLADHEVRDTSSLQVLLIDGPAGIGKTTFIEHLAALRAENFKTTQRPLILHVQSRGRVLTFLEDLIAFSLQTLRLRVTYDQIPILVRHGLVSLAIDGFDELGDPNGYDLAWSQVNDLVDQVRGRGVLILAGRETFIGSERLVQSIRSLSQERDTVNALSLKLPNPGDAAQWLNESWSDGGEKIGMENEYRIKQIENLFEPGSYALRPFFLSRLADPDLGKDILEGELDNLLPYLVNSMIEREATKFGDAVDSNLDLEQRKNFVRQFIQEVARDMADQQTDVLDESQILWIVDVAMPEDIPDEIQNLLRNRANVMAFLTTDERPGYRRFAHSQLLNHFLSEVTMDVLVDNEIPKFIRRNILAADFLSAFSIYLTDVFTSNRDLLDRFFDAVSKLVVGYPWGDRGSRNMGAMLFAMLSLENEWNVELENLYIDEALLEGDASPARIARVTVNQLDVRGADLGELTFTDTKVGTLIVNDSTRVSVSFPDPSVLVIQRDGSGTTSGASIRIPDEITDWLDRHGRVFRNPQALIPEQLHEHGMINLLDRICRIRSYWISDDGRTKDYLRCLRDPMWPTLLEILRRHRLVREDTKKSAGGQARVFYHIVNAAGILGALWQSEVVDQDIRDFYASIVEELRKDLEVDSSP